MTTYTFGYLMFGIAISAGVGVAAFFIARYKQGLRMGAASVPLSTDDRLRVSLALSSLVAAEKEFAKAAWIGNMPGHPLVGDLLWKVNELSDRARKLLRES